MQSTGRRHTKKRMQCRAATTSGPQAASGKQRVQARMCLKKRQHCAMCGTVLTGEFHAHAHACCVVAHEECNAPTHGRADRLASRLVQKCGTAGSVPMPEFQTRQHVHAWWHGDRGRGTYTQRTCEPARRQGILSALQMPIRRAQKTGTNTWQTCNSVSGLTFFFWGGGGY